MGIDRVLRNAILIISLALAAPAIAPSLLAYTVMSPDLHVAEETPPPAQKPAAAKPAAPAPSAAPPPPGATVALRADQYGSFIANPVINGHAVRAVVDTGATVVAISEDMARKLGVRPSRNDTVMVSTANGVTTASSVMLREIRVGEVVLRNVEAVVLPGQSLDTALLGMSFLKRLKKFEFSSGRLVLTQ